MVRRAWRDKHDGIKIVALPLKLKILSSKNRFENFGILAPGDLNFDLRQKMTEMISKFFSRAFERRFPFCSTMRRSRDRRGGCSNTPPPPQQVVENPEAQQGAGLTGLNKYVA